MFERCLSCSVRPLPLPVEHSSYPTVRIQVEGKGSSTAPPALIAGTSQLGPMSRSMTSAETDAIEKKYGFQPVQIRTALDAGERALSGGQRHELGLQDGPSRDVDGQSRLSSGALLQGEVRSEQLEGDGADSMDR